MNLTNTTYSHFKSPLNLIPSFKSRAPCSEPQMESDNPDQLEISNVRSLSESLTDENISNQSPTETPRLKAPDLKKSFQRFPRLKLDKMFSRRLNVTSELQGSFKSKLKQLRSLSQNFAPNRTTIRKNPSKIEERIKKFNIYLTNKFLYKRYPKGSKGLKKPEQEVLDLIEIEDLEEAKVANIERVGRVTGRVDMLNYSNDSIMEQDINEDSPSAEECTVNLNDNNNIVQGIVANSAVLEQPMETANLVLPENTSNTTADTTNADTLNMNTEPIITVNSQSPTAADVQMNNLTDIVERETHFRLRRAFISFLCVFLGSISLTFMFENGFTHRAFFLSLYSFLIYYFIEGCKKISSHEVIDWKKVENLFNTIDIATVFFFLIIADLKLSGVISTTSFATVVPLASSSLYYFSSKAPRSVLESQTITRVLFALQIFLLTARLDGNIDWPWKGVVVLFWLYLGMMVLYFILLAFMMVLMVVLSVFKINLYQNMDTKTQLIGFFWYLLYTSLSPLLFTTLIGVCDAYDHKQDFTLLHDCVIFARYFAIAAMLYTKLTHPILITFLQKFNIDEPEFRIQMRSPDSSTMTKIEIEKRDIYLVMMSSTYFLPLKQDFFLKSKENIKRCKRAIFGSGNRFLRRGYFKKKTLNQNKKQYTPITIEALRKAKEELAKRFKRSTMKKSSSTSTKKETKKGMNRIPSFNFLSFPVDWDSRKVEEAHKDALSVKDVESCFSEEDKEYMTNWSLNENNDMNHAQDKGTDNLCYICVERACNAVMMKCGHGGICYECAIEFVKSKNQCMECRGVIENVVKINPNPKVKNIIKGYETTKLIGGVKHWEDE